MVAHMDPAVGIALLDALPDGILLLDRQLTVIHANRGVHRLLDAEIGQLIGRPVASLYWDDDEARGLVPARGAAASGAAAVRALRTGSGARRMCLLRTVPVGELVALIVRDADEVHDALDRLVRSEASFRAVIENSPDCVLVHQQGRIVYVNHTLLEMWGGPADELIGRPAIELVHPDDHGMVIERITALSAGQPIAPYIDEHLIRRDGSVWVAQVGAVGVVFEGEPSVLVVARDVTEQRQLQAGLAHADRMVALGTLAAGVAHEIGNPLTYVLLRLDAATVRAGELRRDLHRSAPALVPVVDDLAGHVAAVIDGARRVRAIVAELKVFARADDEPVELEVTVPLERALTMAAHELKDVELIRKLSPAPRVRANDGKLTQVFLNLVLNAIHAVRAARRTDPARVIEVRVWGQADSARVAIRDSGPGIEPDDLPRLFDPFFSTKPPGEGAGLGLAITHSIVDSLGGLIEVDSQPGGGATFTVVLPAA